MFMYLVSFVMVMSSNDWFFVWMGLEINMMSFLILIYRRYSLGVIESCLKYFFIQSLGSVILITMFYIDYDILSGITSLILCLKVGAGPFFFWFPSVCSGLNWMSCYMLMLFQKILPLMLMVMFSHWILWYVVWVGLLVGVFGSFNQCNIKQLMAYSSIHHLGWIMLIMMKGGLDWLIYIMLYGLVLLCLVILFMEGEITDFSMMSSSDSKVWFLFGMMSMAGIPPFLGFYLSWMALYNIMDLSLMYLMFLVMVSVVMLYVYMRVIYSVMLDYNYYNCIMVGYFYNYYGYYSDLISVMGIIGGVLMGLYLLL
uniref:NADH-ubiquinone oxidoreductase chain 2 n=1 Tax=Phanuelus gladstone TaxID=2059714 RepID=A0A7U0M8D1_9ARAC|nr:NADH dehydrogenase subunit 2 [Phanuelus gladstone]QQX28272.1 NADH dehydrogenase subunit 2 [Phanuelus gladstone]